MTKPALVFASSVLLFLCFANAASRTVRAQQADADRQEVKQLVETIRNVELRQKDPQRVIGAIKRLGQNKAAEAAEDLSSLIDFQDPSKQAKGLIIGENVLA